jgi:hypothetical protein
VFDLKLSLLRILIEWMMIVFLRGLNPIYVGRIP